MELFSGECFFQARQQAKTEQVAEYFSELAAYLHQQGYQHAHFFLDNNTTHQAAMRSIFQQQTSQLPLQVTFHYFSTYSPKLNIVEYYIHLIRQKWLHHADYLLRLDTVEKKLVQYLHRQVFLPQENLINILQHIQNLVLKT